MAIPAMARAPKPAASLAAAPVYWATLGPVEEGLTGLAGAPVPVATAGVEVAVPQVDG